MSTHTCAHAHTHTLTHTLWATEITLSAGMFSPGLLVMNTRTILILA